jgi:hypothetical protein
LALIFLHFFACGWSLLAKLNLDTVSWTSLVNKTSFTDGELYYLSIYYGLTIFTTIGFGTIRATNPSEYIFSTFFMIFGALYYTIFTGILSSVYNNMYFKDN